MPGAPQPPAGAAPRRGPCMLLVMPLWWACATTRRFTRQLNIVPTDARGSAWRPGPRSAALVQTLGLAWCPCSARLCARFIRSVLGGDGDQPHHRASPRRACP